MAEPQVPAKTEPIEAEEGDEDATNPAYTVFVQLPSGDKIELPMSSTDTMMEVRQFLSDASSSCYMTSYSLHFKGRELGETDELSTLGDALTEKPVLVMKEVLYTEHSARMHVRRLRELLECLVTPEKSATVFTLLDSAEEAASEEEKNAMIQEFDKQVTPTLGKYYPLAKNERLQPSACVKSIAFSGWNPPPGNRRLQGDLFYLEVLTVESKHLFITASVSGFVINQSTRTVFNPAPEKGAKKVAPAGLRHAFSKGFTALLEHEFGAAHPFELLPVPLPISPWTLRSKKHTYESNRLEDPPMQLDSPGLVRDWNEEFQACFEQPKSEVRDRIMRDRALIKVVSEFFEAATRGAIAIVHKNVLPLNPGEPEKTHMWMYSNIFFSAATDVRDQYGKWGGDATSYKAVKIDLNGANRVFQLANPDIRPVLTAIVDYRGHRLSAQAIIPGIMQNSQTERVVYGFPEPGKPINVDPSFAEALISVAKEFHLAERTVKDPANGKDVVLHTASDSKGVLGADGRRYFLDLSRLMPRDCNYKDDPHRLVALHRFEFLLQFDAYYARMFGLSDEELQKRKLTDVERRVLTSLRSTNKSLIEYEATKKETILRMQAIQQEATKTSELSAELRKEFEALREKLQHTAAPRLQYGFNSDFWGPAELIFTPEERAKQEDLLTAAGYFLKSRLIPELIKDWAEGSTHVPVDGQHLTHSLHRAGVPIRYLGEIATISKKELPFLVTVAVIEMVARTAKHLFNTTLKSTTDDAAVAGVISHFLNALLGRRENDEKRKKQDKAEKSEKAGDKTEKLPVANGELPTRLAVPPLTTTALWDTIAQVVKEEYNFVLGKEERSTISRLALLRSLCLKVGLQVAARDYDWTAEHPFSPTDVLDLFPIARTLLPRSTDGSILLEEGRLCLTMGQLDSGFHNLTEALAIFHQVYGPMHPDTANCYSCLGQLLFHAGDTAQAAVHQRKAVIVFERVCGLDHFETVMAYHALAQFANVSSQVVQGLRFLHRAMMLNSLVSGGVHPDHVQDLTNAAVMLHECGASALALRYLMTALDITKAAADGANSEATAAVHHMMAFIHGAQGDYKEAMQQEKQTYSIYKNLYGETNQRTQESNTWLKQFTAHAVQTRRESNKQAEEIVAAAWNDPRVRRMVQNQLGASFSSRPSPAEVSQLMSKLRYTPETLQRMMQRGAAALAAAAPAEPNGAPAPKGKSPAAPAAAASVKSGPQRRRRK